MKTATKSLRQKESGSTFHMVYDRKTKFVELCVWESPSGQLVALDNDWMYAFQQSDSDPVPELLRAYGELESDQ